MSIVGQRLSRRNALFASAAAMGAAGLLRDAPPARAARGPNNPLPVQKINQVFGTEGSLDEGVLAFDLSRSDFKHTSIMGVPVDPDIGFDTEITFQPWRDEALVKWEFCLLDSEVNGVLDGLLQAHLPPPFTNINALHNHFLQPHPEVKFLHGTALGHPVGIAQSLYGALKKNSGQPFETSPPQNTGLPNKAIAHKIGGSFSVSGKVLSVTVDRAEKGLELGVPVRPAAQNESMFTFQKVDQGAAVVAEYVLVSEEVEKVATVARMNGFKITALHNHEIDEEPNYWYMHTFNTGDPLDMAASIRMALEKTGSEIE